MLQMAAKADSAQVQKLVTIIPKKAPKAAESRAQATFFKKIHSCGPQINYSFFREGFLNLEKDIQLWFQISINGG